MDYKLRIMARTGYVAKGIVYAITGALTLLAALHLGGEKPDKMQVLKFVEEQPFGKVLLAIMALGLLCYSCWRLFQALSDPENIGSDTKAYVKRAGFFISGALYLAFASAAIFRIWGSGGSGSGNAEDKPFLASTTGIILIGVVGAAVVIAAFRQFQKVFKQNYLKEFDLSSITDANKRQAIKRTADFGLAARGVIFLIMGYFALKASINANPDEIKDTSDAFDFIHHSSYGTWLLGVVAAGLVAYAFHMFLLARYRKFRD
jgi:hypothetical protein